MLQSGTHSERVTLKTTAQPQPAPKKVNPDLKGIDYWEQRDAGSHSAGPQFCVPGGVEGQMAEVPATPPYQHSSTLCRCLHPQLAWIEHGCLHGGQEDTSKVPGLPDWMSTLASLAWSSLLSLPLILSQ